MTKDSRKDTSSENPKRKKLFSIRNLIVLILVTAVAAVVGNKFGLFDKLPFVGKETAVYEQPPHQAVPAASSHQAAPKTAAADRAGGKSVVDVMNSHFVAVEETVTAGQAVQQIKNKDIGPQVVFVTDSTGRLVGVSSPAKLLVAPEGETVKNLMEHDVNSVPITADIAAAGKMLHAAGTDVLPVVKEENILVGLITTGQLKARSGDASHQGAQLHASAASASAAKAQGHDAKTQQPHATGTEHSASGHAPVATGGHDDPAADETHAAQQSHKPAEAGDPPAEHAAAPAAHSGQHQASAGEAALPHGQSAGPAPAHGAKTLPSGPTGVAFVEALIKPLKYELDDRFYGWRPNDILDFTDNVNNFQLGVLEVTRRAAVALAERISRTGTIEHFDPNVQNAMNWLMIKSDRYWLPSPEHKYGSAIEELEKYRDRLMRAEASFYTRQDNLIPLLVAFSDLLGSSEENLVKPTEKDGTSVSFFKADDYFYYAQGVVSAMGTMLEAVAVDFHDTVQSRRGSDELHHAIHWCHAAQEIQPWLILDSGYSSIFANHRVNLAGPISHIRFHLGVLITTLST